MLLMILGMFVLVTIAEQLWNDNFQCSEFDKRHCRHHYSNGIDYSIRRCLVVDEKTVSHQFELA